mgnify:FL=1
MNKDARFYFANLGADIARCVAATERGDTQRYEDSLDRAYQTLSHLRAAKRPEAYEEGTLLLSGLEIARREKNLTNYSLAVNQLIAEYSSIE